MTLDPYTPVDLCVGALLGFAPPDRLPELEPHEDIRTVVDDMLLDALRRGPVAVLHTGSMGAAGLLAHGANLAREHGYAEPVPLSLRFGHPRTREAEAVQERIVARLGLDRSWERLDGTAVDFDLLGPLAQAVLERHGLAYPANAFWVQPLMERFGRGTIFVSHAEDELFGFWPYREVWQALKGRRRPTRRTLRIGLFGVAPARVRAALMAKRFPPPDLPWLTAEGRAAVAERWTTPFPRRWSGYLRLARRQRCTWAMPRTFQALAEPFGARVIFPWQEAKITQAMIEHSDATGVGSFAELATRYFGEVALDPPEAYLRQSIYGEVFHGAATAEFAERWSGGGLDERLADPGVLRELWASGSDVRRTSALLHQAWLHDRAA